MRPKPEPGTRRSGDDATGARRKRIRHDLERRGVAPEVCDALSQALEGRLTQLPPSAYDSLLEGVALASGVQRQQVEERPAPVDELREIERLMSAFASELSKLDEVLEVLAAYVRRMRTNSPKIAERILH